MSSLPASSVRPGFSDGTGRLRLKLPLAADDMLAVLQGDPDARIGATRGPYALRAVSGFRGRSRVWRLTEAPGAPPAAGWYVKRFQEPGPLRTQVAALAHLDSLAAPGSALSVPRLVSVCLHQRLVATTALAGKDLGAILRHGCRIDHALSWPRVDLARTALAVARGFRWVWTGPMPPRNDLHDYGPGSIAARLHQKTQRLEPWVPNRHRHILTAVESVSRMLKAARRPVSFVLGDASPANLLVDSDRLGVVDLEDAGVGDWKRDVSVLIDHLDRAMRSIHYWAPRVAGFRRTFLEHVGVGEQDRWVQVYRVELLLDAMWSSCQGRTDPQLPKHGRSMRSLRRDLRRTLRTLGLW